MSFTARIFIFVILVAFAASAFAREPHAQSDRAALIHLEHVWQQAALAGNNKALEKILDARFMDTSWRNKLRTKAEMLSASSAPRNRSAKLSDLQVRLFGNTAIVTGMNTVRGTDNSWRVSIRFTDVFLKKHGRWRAIGAQESLVKASGKTR